MQKHIEKQLELDNLPQMPLEILYEKLDDFGLYAGWDYKRVYGWYRWFKAHGQLPFSGGYAEQPEDVMHDFGVFSLLEMALNYPQTSAGAGNTIEDLRGEPPSE